MNKAPTSKSRRRNLQLLTAACVVGVGAGIAQYRAERRRPPTGHPTPVDFGDLEPGKMRTVEWQGLIVLVLRRSPEEVAALSEREDQLIDPASLQSMQTDACRNRGRSLRPDLFVALGQCTHQGCPPQLRSGPGPYGELLCPCHSSKYDLAGRVFRAGPAPANLVIPEYRLDGESRIVIGEL